jgi:hypothetical protein
MNLDKIINIIRSLNEDGSIANVVGDGSKVALPPIHEPGIDLSKKRKKNYAKGGKNSRKWWLQYLKQK